MLKDQRRSWWDPFQKHDRKPPTLKQRLGFRCSKNQPWPFFKVPKLVSKSLLVHCLLSPSSAQSPKWWTLSKYLIRTSFNIHIVFVDFCSKMNNLALSHVNIFKIKISFKEFAFFNPADSRGITEGGLPGFPTQLWHLPQVVPRVYQTTGSVHPQPTLPNC